MKKQTPKEKANELVEKFLPQTRVYHEELGLVDYVDQAKECALISVDETIKALNILLKSGLNNDFDILALRGDYTEIKKEIELL